MRQHARCCDNTRATPFSRKLQREGCARAPQRDARPAYFFVAAAHAAIERRRGAARARDAAAPAGKAGAAVALVPGAYVGQLLAPPGQRVPDAAFEQHVAARGPAARTGSAARGSHGRLV